MTAPPFVPGVMRPETPVAANGTDPAKDHAALVKKIKGPQYPTPDAPDGEKKRYVLQLREDDNAQAIARYQQGTRNICYANGRQHISWNTRTRQWDDLPVADPGELRATLNYIRLILRGTANRMMSAPIDFSLLPDSNANEARDRAATGARFADARWRLIGMRPKLAASLDLAYACGVVAWKSFWNPDIGPLTPATMKRVQRKPMVDPETGGPVDDGSGQPATEVVYDEAGQPVEETYYVDEAGQPVQSADEAFYFRPGDTDTAVRSIFHLRVNPEATGWTAGDGLRWLIDSEVVPISVARARYPDIADRIQASDVPDSALTYERIAASSVTQRAGGPLLAAGASGNQARIKGDTVTIHEYWELPNEPCYPKGRLVVMVGEICAFDDAFPDKWFPYVPVFDEPTALTAWGRPRINDMISPSNIINRQWSAIDAEMQLSGVGKWVSWDVEGIPDQITSADRTVMKVPWRTRIANKSIRDIVHRMEPAQVSGDRWRLIETAKATLYDVGAYHEVSRGQVPPGVDSGVAIKQLLEQEAGQLLPAMLALKESIANWVKCQLAIARNRYADDDTRWLPVDRPDLGFQIENVKGVDLPDPMTVQIELENFKPHSETARRAEVLELFKEKLIDGRQTLKAYGMGTGASALFDRESRHYARAANENLAIERGEFELQPPAVPEPGTEPQSGPPEPLHLIHEGQVPFLLPEDDDHPLHMEVLDELILDDQKPWRVRQAALTHKAEHRWAMSALMAQQALDAPPEAAPLPPEGQ